MKILVYGAGAVGSYFGARLAHADHDVTLIMRPGAAAAVNNIGLNVNDMGGRIFVRPTAVASLRQSLLEGKNYDLILLTMKAYDTERALNELVAFCPNPPPLLTLQNGIGIEQPFIEQFGPERIIAGSVTIPISIDAAGSVLVERGNRGLALAPTRPKGDIRQWIALFQEIGITTETVANYQAMKWSKAFLNIIGNASSAILNRHPTVIYKNNLTFNLEISMLKETMAVMRRLKLPILNLPGSSARHLALSLRWLPRSLLKPILIPIVSKGRGEKMPSFHIDLTNKQGKNEVIYHNGAIAEIGREHNIPTPVNAAFNDVLLKLVREEIPWETYSGEPRKLAAEVGRYRQAFKQRKNAR